jgi:hypothetical protein
MATATLLGRKERMGLKLVLIPGDEEVLGEEGGRGTWDGKERRGILVGHVIRATRRGRERQNQTTCTHNPADIISGRPFVVCTGPYDDKSCLLSDLANTSEL